MRAGTWRVFERRYSPIYPRGEDDNCLIQTRDGIPEGTPDSKVWSVVDCDGKLIIVPGYAMVNWFAYIITLNPLSERDQDREWIY